LNDTQGGARNALSPDRSRSRGLESSHVIRLCTAADAAAICEIYNPYVRDTVITFEETPVAVAEMAQRIVDVTARLPWLVAEEQGAIVGYAYATPWKVRSAYRFSVESSVYVAPGQMSRGVGTALYRELIPALRQLDVHCAVGGIALPNAASVALHEKLGFKKIGQFVEIGRKFNRWVDVGYWELIL
jgi:phosphinothricin acetyltransferase